MDLRPGGFRDRSPHKEKDNANRTALQVLTPPTPAGLDSQDRARIADDCRMMIRQCTAVVHATRFGLTLSTPSATRSNFRHLPGIDFFLVPEPGRFLDFATPAHISPSNRQMHNPIQRGPETQVLKYKKCFGSTQAAKTTEETSMSIKDRHTTLSMIVLLLACLALAALAHALV